MGIVMAGLPGNVSCNATRRERDWGGQMHSHHATISITIGGAMTSASKTMASADEDSLLRFTFKVSARGYECVHFMFRA